MDVLDQIDDLLSLVGAEDHAVQKARKPGILSRRGFDQTVEQIAMVLRRTTGPTDDHARARMIRALDRRWLKLSEEERARAIEAATRHVSDSGAAQAEAAAAAMAKAMPSAIMASKEAAIGRFALNAKLVFDAVDQRQVDHATKCQALYVRDELGRRRERYSAVARKVVARGIEGGLSSWEISEQLSKDMTAIGASRSLNYWRVIASIFTARARTFGTLSSFADAGITRGRFSAVLDEVTSVMCRFMNGRIIDVRSSLDRFGRVAEGDPESVVDEQPWMRLGKTDDGQEFLFVKAHGRTQHIAMVDENAVGTKDDPGKFSRAISDERIGALGCSCPPLHPNCRSLILPA